MRESSGMRPRTVETRGILSPNGYHDWNMLSFDAQHQVLSSKPNCPTTLEISTQYQTYVHPGFDKHNQHFPVAAWGLSAGGQSRDALVEDDVWHPLPDGCSPVVVNRPETASLSHVDMCFLNERPLYTENAFLAPEPFCLPDSDKGVWAESERYVAKRLKSGGWLSEKSRPDHAVCMGYDPLLLEKTSSAILQTEAGQEWLQSVGSHSRVDYQPEHFAAERSDDGTQDYEQYSAQCRYYPSMPWTTDEWRCNTSEHFNSGSFLSASCPDSIQRWLLTGPVQWSPDNVRLTGALLPMGSNQGTPYASTIQDGSLACRKSKSISSEDNARKGAKKHKASQRGRARDEFLVRCKQSGMSYKEIKTKGQFPEAESTLRGRYRTLTKQKEHRVRKPEWERNDLRLLCEAVTKHMDSPKTSGPQSPKISWKQVAEYIWNNGGSYHFGNATCKKKWVELREQRPRRSPKPVSRAVSILPNRTGID
ncbi:hypothetical protein LOZ39_003358, partial [Ophidiomyces ophidiicola]